MEPIVFTDPQTGETDLFYVIEETALAGNTYLLVAEEEEADSDAFLLRLTAVDENGEATYEVVEDRRETEALIRVFSELLDEDTVIEE